MRAALLFLLLCFCPQAALHTVYVCICAFLFIQTPSFLSPFLFNVVFFFSVSVDRLGWYNDVNTCLKLFSHSSAPRLSLSVCPSLGNQMDAKESDMSDTLSPSKDRSSDDTSGKRTTCWARQQLEKKHCVITSFLFVCFFVKDQTFSFSWFVFPFSNL